MAGAAGDWTMAAWDCWARHVKLTPFGGPDMITNAAVGKSLQRAWERNFSHGERVCMVGEDGASLSKPSGRGGGGLDDGRLVRVDSQEFLKTVREKFPEFTSPKLLEDQE